MSGQLERVHMVDLKSQYLEIKAEVLESLNDILESCRFIGGENVKLFEKELALYLNVKHVISCANGTDALQIALMAMNLQKGDEVIVPAFTYAATAEVVALLGLKPVMVDVSPSSFNTSLDHLLPVITDKTRAIVPVHLFGQNCDMQPILEFCTDRGIALIEDAAQSIGSIYTNGDKEQSSGAIGDVGCTSFFPSKNLGCYGDGGAMFTNDDELAEKLRMIANHGQNKRYYHEIVGVNSRLDAIQAAVLRVKLKNLDSYIEKRNRCADVYNNAFKGIAKLKIPKISKFSTHVFHQYTLQVDPILRDRLISHLDDQLISTSIYYPIPLYEQNAFKSTSSDLELVNTRSLCDSVLSLPIYPELSMNDQERVINGVLSFINKN